MLMPIYDLNYWILLGPAILLALWAQSRVKGAYNTWSRVPASSGVTGAELARALLRDAGVDDVRVEPIAGHLTDHYDPRAKAVRLSQPVYNGRSLAALGIAAHEVGHVLQHDQGYVWLGLRQAIIPITQLGSNLAMPLVFLGLLMSFPGLVDLGILLFLFAVLFQVVTLPVEFNASSRAVGLLTGGGYVVEQESGGVREVLNAAALTYVAALIVALMQLVYLFMLRGRE